MLKITQAYVVKSGRLVGVLTRNRLADFVGTREKRPMDRCLQLMASCADCLCCRGLRRSRGAGGSGSSGRSPPRRRDSYPVLRPVERPSLQVSAAVAAGGGGGGGGEGMV
jgi:hypothetical protein